MELIKVNSKKQPKEIVEEIKSNASKFDFIVRETFDMGKQFQSHGIDVDLDFEYYSIMVCNPKKAYQSIKASPLRGAVLLPPKQIVVYKDLKTNQTVIAYMKLDKKSISEIMPDDIMFQEGLEGSCDQIIKLIKSVGDNNEI
jgi:uncharacterized protein (DUF302 family)